MSVRKAAATAAKPARTTTEKQDQIWNISEVAEQIGMATRGKPLSDTRVRALIDREGKQEIDADGKRIRPLDVEYRATGKWKFLFIKDADSDRDTVQAYIDAVKRGEYNTRTAGARLVLHNATKLADTLTLPEGITVPDGMTVQALLEAIASANGMTFKVADSGKAAEDDEDDDATTTTTDAEAERRAAVTAATPA